MKLNLLPTYVGRGRQLGVAIFAGVIMIAVSIVFSVTLDASAAKALAKAQDQAHSYENPVNAAVTYAQNADSVVQPLRQVLLNTQLANDMQAHCEVYPKFYDSIFPYIPDFFRITSMQAVPNDPNNVTLTLTGVIKTHQQYADLMLALLRIPGATTVSRSGFTPTAPFVPNVSAADQSPTTQDPDQPVLPKDGLQRLDALIASGKVSGFAPKGNFGSGKEGERDAMPDYQLVTVSVQMPGQLQTPNPRQTLAVGGGGGGAVRVGGGGKRGPAG